MDWRDKTLVVTGGAGFLGSTIARLAAARGARVRIIDAFLPETGANAANLEGVAAEIHRLDLRHDPLETALAGAEAIVHCAAQISHAGSEADPLGDLGHNAVGTLRLILAAREAAPDAAVVHASTRQMYGRARSLPVAEDHPIEPPDANAVSKWAAEQYWLLEHRLRGRPVVSLRLTNCYGPGLRVKDARQTFLGIWIRRVLEGEPFEVWGGEQTRDLAYGEDVAEAFLAAFSAPSGIYNLGGSPPVSLRALADLLVAVHGGGRYQVKEMPPERAKIDIGSYVADDSRFRAATGWAPRVPLEEGLARTLAWYRDRLPLYLRGQP
ncbi:NAD-dependent epimerase/dehydratase family protein [Elioraea thermophila]|uniref:NAD-dependent epimerase/dehydratase family protein n=1 Tax=Elioraea thermophila TaxID=2185104 RepID=UPI000DF12FD5|nr:NAD-dependent epimerase/dehydratase family protein [Elioraea thermophila]